MSLIPYSAIHRRFAACAALLAMLLLFIAPVISTSLAQHHGGSGMMLHQGMEMDMAMPADHQPPVGADVAISNTTHTPSPIMDDAACGYCVLLVHLPLDLFPSPLLWSSLQAVAAPDVPPCQRVISLLAPHFFHPRAPPRCLPVR
ncbi:DUF2946 domain-containing protein [Erwinia tasmaniensis]|uniref:DUF2946 domain-containing protein n=1 Tax=Erwinia tasmaniensis (strain DSM 17950 / CFBP 7177 / CIP 109463 / NCPPB 4357 / Et1/99) TaxID=465817 RepID=B2VH91_ERWT9|nr:DUF2946 domain-containing protein [Erwinia tasmaniensis]CAO95648.1 Hypothetical protein ETA_06020 [Erwinia tasmaniensis Et1/99]